MIIEDWEDFLDYLNYISGTNDFDIEGLQQTEGGVLKPRPQDATLGTSDKNRRPTAGAQVICDGLWNIVKKNPAFRQKADVDNIATDNGMMVQPGWYLESTLFDATDGRGRPYIFYALANPTATLEGSSLFAILFYFHVLESTEDASGLLEVNKWQLINQIYEGDDDGRWREVDSGPDDTGWEVPGFGYIMSEVPILNAPVGYIINFPYEARLPWAVLR